MKQQIIRRRIYDIVNLLESVGVRCPFLCTFFFLKLIFFLRRVVKILFELTQVFVRKAKNRYSWKRFDGIPKAFQELKGEYTIFISCNIAYNECGLYGCKVCVSDENDKPSIQRIGENVQEELQRLSTFLIFLSRNKLTTGEKSLGLLTQNFVKLFLCTNADMVSLDEAARLLLGDAPKSAQMPTKVRRLYDIANVLSSMNLIEKTNTRKPAFRWLGLVGKPDSDLVPCDKTSNDQGLLQLMRELLKCQLIARQVVNMILCSRKRGPVVTSMVLSTKSKGDWEKSSRSGELGICLLTSI
ncbi:E2F transcription factor-like E2FE isoform X2 [Aristolochia californica]|uniref:E2F transcription factor-like E2FE isoform X2 n=1 Tax=Aristolochia californica TaxID=171875 RepID=UPI0035DDFCDD